MLFGTTLQLGGPIWTEPIHHQEFVHSLLSEVKENKEDFRTYNRIVGLLTVVSEVSLYNCTMKLRVVDAKLAGRG